MKQIWTKRAEHDGQLVTFYMQGKKLGKESGTQVVLTNMEMNATTCSNLMLECKERSMSVEKETATWEHDAAGQQEGSAYVGKCVVHTANTNP